MTDERTLMIDSDKLQEQLAAAMHQPPWCVYPPTDRWGAGIGARSTKYTIGGFEFGCDDELAVAAVNALSALLAVYEAACAVREYCHDPNRGGFKARDGARLHAALFDAIDAARGTP